MVHTRAGACSLLGRRYRGPPASAVNLCAQLKGGRGEGGRGRKQRAVHRRRMRRLAQISSAGKGGASKAARSAERENTRRARLRAAARMHTSYCPTYNLVRAVKSTMADRSAPNASLWPCLAGYNLSGRTGAASRFRLPLRPRWIARQRGSYPSLTTPKRARARREEAPASRFCTLHKGASTLGYGCYGDKTKRRGGEAGR